MTIRLQSCDNTADLSEAFLLTLRLIQVSQQLFSDVVKQQFEDTDMDLSPSQMILVASIGMGQAPISDSKNSGSKTSYNLKKLFDLGYIRYFKARDGSRGRQIALTDKGSLIRAQVLKAYSRQMLALTTVGGLSSIELSGMNLTLSRLAEFWKHQLTYRL